MLFVKSGFGFSRAERMQENDPVVEYLERYSKITDTVNLYNAFHNLIIPLYVVASDPNSKVSTALDHFFDAQFIIKKNQLGYGLADLHFAYLYTEYMRLLPKKFNDARFNRLKKYIVNYWDNEPGNVWSEEIRQFKGKKARINFLLDNSRDIYPRGRKYLAALTDFDMFCMSIGTSLATIEMHRNGAATKELSDIANTWLSCLTKKVSFSDGNRWLLQPGVWADYPDYMYAGYDDIDNVTSPRIKENIGIDVSHFSRMPAFLLTLAMYFQGNQEAKIYINRLISGLADQFLTAVVTYPTRTNNLYRFKNYMDGSNGVFRFNYSKDNKGYNPYKQASHIFYGFWLLLGSTRINTIYQDIYVNFNQYYAKEEYRWTDYDLDNSAVFYRYLIGLYLNSKMSSK